MQIAQPEGRLQPARSVSGQMSTGAVVLWIPASRFWMAVAANARDAALALPPPPVYTRGEGDAMDDAAEQFLDLIHRLEEIRDGMTPERAHAEFDEITLQVFWMKWPGLSAWAGSLWRMLSEELAGPASPYRDAELDEVGGSE